VLHTDCGPIVWGLSVAHHRFCIYVRTHLCFTESGCLQPGGLQSCATDFGSISALTRAFYRLGAYSLGAVSLAPPTLNLLAHLPVLYTDWGPTVCGRTVWGPTVSQHGFWIYWRTYLCFTQTGGLQSGGLQSRTTDFGFISALTCAFHRLGAYSLGSCSLAPPTPDLIVHLPPFFSTNIEELFFAGCSRNNVEQLWQRDSTYKNMLIQSSEIVHIGLVIFLIFSCSGIFRFVFDRSLEYDSVHEPGCQNSFGHKACGKLSGTSTRMH